MKRKDQGTRIIGIDTRLGHGLDCAIARQENPALQPFRTQSRRLRRARLRVVELDWLNGERRGEGTWVQLLMDRYSIPVW